MEDRQKQTKKGNTDRRKKKNPKAELGKGEQKSCAGSEQQDFPLA